MRSHLALLFSCTLVVLPASSSRAAERRVNVTKALAPGAVVRVENPAGSVRVRGWARPELRVSGTLGEGVKDLEYDITATTATISVKVKRGLTGRAGNAQLEIEVPRECSLDAETVSAEIVVRDVDGPLALQTVSGPITVAGARADVEVKSVSGDIAVAGASARVRAESVSGTIRVEQPTGAVDAQTVSGSIHVSGEGLRSVVCESVSGAISCAGSLSGTGRFSFDSFSGSVELRLPPDTDAHVTISTLSGTVVNELAPAGASSGKEGSFTLGEGKATVEITTLSGDVALRRLSR